MSRRWVIGWSVEARATTEVLADTEDEAREKARRGEFVRPAEMDEWMLGRIEDVEPAEGEVSDGK